VLKESALSIGLRAGVFSLARLARGRQASILMFHRFAQDEDPEGRALSIQKFAAYLAYLTRSWRVVSLRQLTDELAQGVARPHMVAVTVDDGYEDFYSLAAPVLRRYGVPATVFVVSDFIDGRCWLWPDRYRFVLGHAPRRRLSVRHRGADHVLELADERGRPRAIEGWVEHAKRIPTPEREDLLQALAEACGVELPAAPPPGYRPMTWAQLRALAGQGFDVGAHTRTHPILSRVRPSELAEEIEGCKHRIEHQVGFPVRHFAYPNGGPEDYTPEAVEAVARAGYRAAVTTVAGGNRPSTPRLELRRTSAAARDLAHFAQSVSGFEEAKARLRAWLGLGHPRQAQEPRDWPQPAQPLEERS
jgi:peptidoglycan/xylan/chitin deacetylase (PgdA/CDA1 family)